MTDIARKLFELRDEKYADFQSKLTPTLEKECFIGVRVPVLREFAKEFAKTGDVNAFLDDLPHKYYDENMLHSILLCSIKNYDECIKRIDEFLPFVDNWAVCDTCSPKVLKKDLDRTLEKIKEWVKSSEPYTIRFGIEILMNFYLDKNFSGEYLEIPAKVKSEEYYVKMMIAWFYATALTKQWDSTICYIENNRLGVWEHNKTIQKARESYRITPNQKEYLKGLKI